jgi:hypothetical protein
MRLDQIESNPISFREVFVVGDRLVRRRMDLPSERLLMVYDRDVPALRIAQDFIREVLLHRLS